jgi:hypothetical protein
MPTPLAKAAKRGATFRELPMIVAGPSFKPRSSRWRRTYSPDFATEPDNARPRPSRIDFLPSETTSAGMSAKRVLQTKAATWRVVASVGRVFGIDAVALIGTSSSWTKEAA